MKRSSLGVGCLDVVGVSMIFELHEAAEAGDGIDRDDNRAGNPLLAHLVHRHQLGEVQCAQ
jgi:hypothetical protein